MGLNVIALISGGKDSFFSILHCEANGHKVVALANLHPSPSASDHEDTNSYMYQTVGHAVIPLYEQALGIPLYRQEITGKAINSARDYSAPAATQEGDETEDLVPLLQRVQLAHPEANAVSTGAILSTYQRTRVESVALRLGLAPLSYLWQFPVLPPYSQSQLLRDMAAVGQEAVIIKTASGGLDERILGWNVAAPSTVLRLQKAMARFGEGGDGAVLGEGGEFETLALDGPRPLWKKRIRIEPGAAGVSESGQSVLRMRGSELEEKSEGSGGEVEGNLRIPDMFDDEFKRLLDQLENSTDARSFASDAATLLNEPVDVVDSTWNRLPQNASADTPSIFAFSNLTSPSRSTTSPTSPARQLTKILLRLDHVLEQWQLSRVAVNHSTLLLRDMSDFTVLNPIYGQYFSSVNPPARVTVALGSSMPEAVDVMLSIIIDKPHTDRKGRVVRAVNRQGLHVQGISYWAPANIGPYSQSVSARLPPAPGRDADVVEVVYVAGQIPLVPASMEVFTARGFRGQAVLALQHLWRIGRVKKVAWWVAGVAFLAGDEAVQERVQIAQAAWRGAHHAALSDDSDDGDEEDDDADIDPWDRRNTHTTMFNDVTARPALPDYSVLDTASQTPRPTPPCYVVQVSSLPRATAIEWSATGLSSTTPIALSSTTTHPTATSSSFYTIQLNSPDDLASLHRRLGRKMHAWDACTLYAGPGLVAGEVEMEKVRWRGVQWVPVQRVWGEGGRECVGVLVGRVDAVA